MPDEEETTPAIATADTDRPPPVIPAGGPERAIADALQHVALATANLASLANAVARQLDATATYRDEERAKGQEAVPASVPDASESAVQQ